MSSGVAKPPASPSTATTCDRWRHAMTPAAAVTTTIRPKARGRGRGVEGVAGPDRRVEHHHAAAGHARPPSGRSRAAAAPPSRPPRRSRRAPRGRPGSAARATPTRRRSGRRRSRPGRRARRPPPPRPAHADPALPVDPLVFLGDGRRGGPGAVDRDRLGGLDWLDGLGRLDPLGRGRERGRPGRGWRWRGRGEGTFGPRLGLFLRLGRGLLGARVGGGRGAQRAHLPPQPVEVEVELGEAGFVAPGAPEGEDREHGHRDRRDHGGQGQEREDGCGQTVHGPWRRDDPNRIVSPGGSPPGHGSVTRRRSMDRRIRP